MKTFLPGMDRPFETLQKFSSLNIVITLIKMMVHGAQMWPSDLEWSSEHVRDRTGSVSARSKLNFVPSNHSVPGGPPGPGLSGKTRFEERSLKFTVNLGGFLPFLGCGKATGNQERAL